MANTNFIGSMWELLKLEDTSFYIETLKQLRTNVIATNKFYSSIIEKYNSVIPYLHVRLDKESSENLFNKYIVPVAYLAASGDRNKALCLYNDMLDYIADYISERTEYKRLIIKKEVA